MLRTALAVVATVVLSGCASLGDRLPHALLQPAITRTECGACAPVDYAPAASTAVVYALSRRSFSPPSRRQPDQQNLFATASDYAWRNKRRTPRRRRYPPTNLATPR